MKAIVFAALLALAGSDDSALLHVLDDSTSPLQLDRVEVVRNPNDTPAFVRVAYLNRLEIPLTRAFIAAFVFDSRGGIRLRSYGVISRPLPASAAGALTIPVNRLEAKPDWRIVVAVERASFGNDQWASADLLQKAKAAIGSSDGGSAAGDATPDGSVWDGIFTNEQAARGDESYGQHCARCHGADLQAMVAERVAKDDELIARGAMHHRTPALVGTEFLGRWNGISVGDLLQRIQISMPQEAPGSLTTREVADLLAFILQQNGFPSGSDAMPADRDALSGVKIRIAR